jgi:dsRNA-specific ribonuclease
VAVGSSDPCNDRRTMKELFRDPALYDQAVTHRTWAVEQGGDDNERLE